MREIKFRAFYKPVKKMCEVVDNDLSRVTAEGYVIMQFTGLHDKNGKEIYDGDIVRLNNATIAIVEYWVNGGQWVIHTPDFDMEGGQGLYQAHINQMEHKVIGNIYDNPELLKEAL